MGNGPKSKGRKHKGKKPKPAPGPAEEEPAAIVPTAADAYDAEADEFFQFGLQVGFNLELRLEDPAQFEEALAMFRDTVTREKMSLAAADAKKNLCAVMMREAKDEAKDDASFVDGEAERRHAGYVWREASKLFAEDAKERAARATMLEARCDAVGEKYPDHVLKDRAAPASSRPTGARCRPPRERRASRERVRLSASSARPRGRRTTASHAGEARTVVFKGALSYLKLVVPLAPYINAFPVVDVGAPAPRDDRFGARSNSRTSLPPIAAARARASTSKCPQVAKAPLWRAFAAFVQSDVGNFAYFVERVDPFDVRFTLPVVMCVHVIDGGFIEAFHLPFDQEAFTTIFGRAVTNEAVGFFRDHSPHADGRPGNQLNQLYLLIADLMVNGSKEQLKFLMGGAHIGCGECARLAIVHLERENPVSEDPRPFF